VSISLPSILTLSTVAFPVTANVAPLNVRFALSSSSPPVPAITTRLSVRSSTIKVLAVTPPLASNNPPIVEIPDTFSDANVPKPAVGEIPVPPTYLYPTM